jgi:hypothetical protein
LSDSNRAREESPDSSHDIKENSMMATFNRWTLGAAFHLTLYMIIGLHIASHSHAQAAGTRCETQECFLEQAALCAPATFDTQFVAGGQARYKVYGPGKKSDECFIDFEFLKNPDPVLVGPFFSFVVQTRQALEPQLKEGVTDCLEGRQGKYNCSGPLWDLVFESNKAANKVEIRIATEPPCGVVTEDEGPPLYPLPRDGKWGYVTRDGVWAIEPRWKYAEPFSEGRAAVDHGNLWGVINKRGDYVLEPVLRSSSCSVSTGNPDSCQSPLQKFSQGCSKANVQNDGSPHPFFVDRDGRFWLHDGLPGALSGMNIWDFGSFSGGRAWFQAIGEGLKESYGWIDSRGKVVLKDEFSGAGEFVDGTAPASSGGDFWGFIDLDGNPVLPTKWKFASARPFSEGMAAVRIDVFTWMYISRDGIVIDKVTFKFPEKDRPGAAGEHGIISKAGSFHDGLAPVERKWGYLDDERLMFIRPDGSEAFAPGSHLGLKVCQPYRLPEFLDGLVQLLVADEGEECDDARLGQSLPDGVGVHYIYLDTSGNIVLQEKKTK